MKITAKGSAIVRITFEYGGATYTQLVCTPGDVNCDGYITDRDIRVIREYISGDLDDLYINSKINEYEVFKLLADMNSDDVSNPVVTDRDITIIRSILLGDY